MNERFKELAIQAKLHMVSEPRMQEFAELIVQECLDVIAMRIYLGPAEICRQECKALASEIKEHFGIEE